MTRRKRLIVKSPMKKIVFWLIISACVMFVLPWMAVAFVNGNGAMAACFILFFAVNPVFSIILGVFSGEDAKRLWWLPVVSAVFFLAGTWMFFDAGETAFILYAAGYLALGIAAMLISALIRKK